MRIIPAIDIINGKCVRLTKGDFSTQKIYNENPLEVAKEFEASGIQYLHLVDLDGARSGKIVNSKILENITSKTSLKVDFGGGIKSDSDVNISFDSGASQITFGSIAVSDKDFVLKWLKELGPEKIILGADCLDRRIAVNGWRNSSDLEVTSFIRKFIDNDLQYCICTDISKDGMLAGPSFELYKEILAKNNINLIASGGITSMDDLKKLNEIGCEGAIIGKAIYENRISLKELQSLC